MQLFLNLLDGSQHLININQHTSVQSILATYNLIDATLISQGAILNDYQLSSLLPYSNIFVTAALEGGKKKKKKKAFTTKKKNKHIHKKIKLLPLTLYSVAGDGKVTQSRKTCPSCGPGTFMAQHWDRYYCGLCHTTIKMDAQTIKKNQQILKKKRAALQAQKKAKEKEAAEKAPAGKGKKDAKKGKKK